MEKKFNLVSSLKIVKSTVTLCAGIVVTLFSCLEEVVADNTFVKDETRVEFPTDSVSYEDFDIVLAPNTDTKNCPAGAESETGGVLDTFVSSVLQETKPLDGDISKFVDDNFWDLI